MIIFLYGKDSYRRNRKIRELREAYQEKHGLIDIAVFDFEDNPDKWREAKDFLNQPSMFVETKLAVVKEAGTVDDKEWRETLKSQAAAPKTFVVLSDKKSPKREFKFLLKEPVKRQEFDELEGAALSGFFQKEAALRELVFDDDASQFFFSYVAGAEERSALVVNELDKLRLLGVGEISLRLLREVIRFEKKEEVWRTAAMILGGGGIHRRLHELEKIFLQKEAPSYIFNSVSYQAKGANALRLADYDVSLKSGGLEYEEALTDFILSS